MSEELLGNILLVDDDAEIRSVLNILLASEGFQVFQAGSGPEALECLAKQGADIDLIILDVMMDGMSGYEVCTRLRERWNVPVLFLTAKSQETDLTLGFSCGCDDYLVKPFSYPELKARVKGLLRRYQVYKGKPCEPVLEELRVEELRLNTVSNRVWKGDKVVELTDTEYRILRLLMENRGKTLSVQNIYESVWQEPYFASSSNTVMVHIRKIREKIETDPRSPGIVKTVWGRGYQVEG